MLNEERKEKLNKYRLELEGEQLVEAMQKMFDFFGYPATLTELRYSGFVEVVGSRRVSYVMKYLVSIGRVEVFRDKKHRAYRLPEWNF